MKSVNLQTAPIWLHHAVHAWPLLQGRILDLKRLRIWDHKEFYESVQFWILFVYIGSLRLCASSELWAVSGAGRKFLSGRVNKRKWSIYLSISKLSMLLKSGYSKSSGTLFGQNRHRKFPGQHHWIIFKVSKRQQSFKRQHRDHVRKTFFFLFICIEFLAVLYA